MSIRDELSDTIRHETIALRRDGHERRLSQMSEPDAMAWGLARQSKIPLRKAGPTVCRSAARRRDWYGAWRETTV